MDQNMMIALGIAIAVIVFILWLIFGWGGKKKDERELERDLPDLPVRDYGRVTPLPVPFRSRHGYDYDENRLRREINGEDENDIDNGNEGGRGRGNGGGGGDDDRPPGEEPPPTTKPPKPDDPPFDPSSIIFEPIIDDPSPEPIEPPKPPIDDDEKIFIDLSPDFLGVRCQDSLMACTAFASASIIEYNFINHFKQHTGYLSPLFLWYNIRAARGEERRNSGAVPSEVMRSLKEEGICDEDLWSFQDISSDKWMTHPSLETFPDARKKRITESNAVLRSDPDQWVYKLLEKKPLYICIKVPGDFCGLSSSLYDNKKPRDFLGGHAIALVGYNSHYPYKDKGIKAFKIRNSWGGDWGENGYAWIPAEILKKLMYRDPIVIDGWNYDPDSATSRWFKGRVVFDHPDMPITESMKGDEINWDENILSPRLDHEMFIGIFAQINGEVQILAEELLADEKGRFEIHADIPWKHIEKPTALSKLFPHQFKEIDFSKFEPGVVLYKRSGDKDEPLNYFFHTVDVSQSKGGRGGLCCKGNYPNPFAGPPLSGWPIPVFVDSPNEVNVVIPIFDYSNTKNNNLKDMPNRITLRSLITGIRDMSRLSRGSFAFEFMSKKKDPLSTAKVPQWWEVANAFLVIVNQDANIRNDELGKVFLAKFGEIEKTYKRFLDKDRRKESKERIKSHCDYWNKKYREAYGDETIQIIFNEPKVVEHILFTDHHKEKSEKDLVQIQLFADWFDKYQEMLGSMYKDFKELNQVMNAIRRKFSVVKEPKDLPK